MPVEEEEDGSLWSSIVDVITFKLVNEDPWLVRAEADAYGDNAEDQEEEEERKLQNSCEGSIARDGRGGHTAARYLDLLFALSTLRLVAGRGGEDCAEDQARAGNSTKTKAQVVVVVVAAKEERKDAKGAKEEEEEEEGLPRNRIEFDIACARLISLVPLLTVVYIFYHLTGAAILLLQHDILISNMQQPTLITNTSTTSTIETLRDARTGEILCARRQDIAYGPKFSVAELARVSAQLDRFGMPNRVQLGVTFLATAIVSMAPILFYLMPMVYFHYYASSANRLDSVAFLYEPVRERARLHVELGRVFQEITWALGIHSNSNSNSSRAGARHKQPPAVVGTQQVKSASITTTTTSNNNNRTQQKILHPASGGAFNASRHLSQAGRRLVRSASFTRLLDEIMRLNLVRPVVVSSEWHLGLKQFVKFLVRLFICISMFLPWFTTLVSYGLDLVMQTLERHKLARCLEWRPDDGAIFKPAHYLAPAYRKGEVGGQVLFFTEQESEAYAKFDGENLLHLAYLALFYEIGHFQSWRVGAFQLMTLIMISLLSVWATLWTTIVVLCCLDKIAWLRQIRAQLTCCYQQVAEQLLASSSSRCDLASLKHGAACELCYGGVVTGDLSEPMKMDESERDLFIKRMTIAYVNAQLFRRQYKPFRHLTNFLVLQAATFALAAFTLLYIIATHIETRFRFFSTMASFFVLVTLNVYLVAASYASKLFESNGYLLMRLIGLTGHYPELAGTHTMSLWRRQLMGDSEVRLLASAKVLSLQITYKQIITINVQLLGMWLLLWRVFNHNKHY